MRLIITLLLIANILVLGIGITTLLPSKSPDSERQWQEVHPERLVKIGDTLPGTPPNALNKPAATGVANAANANNANPANTASSAHPANPLSTAPGASNPLLVGNAGATPLTPANLGSSNPSNPLTSPGTSPSAANPATPATGNHPNPASSATECAAWSGLTKRDEARVVASLATVTKISIKRIPAAKVNTWMVFVPVRTTADLTMNDISSKGIRDGVKAVNATTGAEIISLGFYATEGGAEVRLREIERAGIKDARIGPRQKGGGHRVEVRAQLPDIVKATNAVTKNVTNLDVASCISAP